MLSEFEIATESYMFALSYLLMQWRIEEVANDLVEENTTAADATAEIRQYQQTVLDGTAALNMTPKQREGVRERIKTTAIDNVLKCGNPGVALVHFESWFNEWEKQTFGI